MPGRAFSRPQADHPGPRVLWFSGLRVEGGRWGLGGSLARLRSCANTPCHWFLSAYSMASSKPTDFIRLTANAR